MGRGPARPTSGWARRSRSVALVTVPGRRPPADARSPQRRWTTHHQRDYGTALAGAVPLVFPDIRPRAAIADAGSICTECNNERVTSTPPVDGRSALRAERRRAILDAARALATEHGPDGFTVEQVASRAGVSRRTVFNHVAGLDQLLVAVCEQILAEATVDLLAEVERRTADLPQGGAGGRAALDAVAEATRGVDLPTAIATIHRVLGCPEVGDERAQRISRTAFDHVGGRLREQVVARAPALDPVDLEIDLALLFSGIVTIAGLWLEQHPDLAPDVPPDARADWDALLDRVLLRLRTGGAG